MKPIVKMVHGSHLYGVNTPESDIDYKGIVLPTREQILLQQANFTISESTGDDKSKNTASDTDSEFYSLHKFLDMACSGEMIAVDMLHCSSPVFQNTIWNELRSIRSMFYTSEMKGYLGYVKKQAHRYGIKGSKLEAIEAVLKYLQSKDQDVKVIDATEVIGGLEGLANLFPEYVEVKRGFWKGNKWIDKIVVDVCSSKFDLTCKIGYIVDQLKRIYDTYGHRAQQAKLNEGIDWKAVSHAIRAGYQLLEIYQTGDLRFPLKEADLILSIKKGERDFTSEVSPILDDVVARVESEAVKSSYPAKVNRSAVNQWLIEVYQRFVL
jgi:hypothetical protein